MLRLAIIALGLLFVAGAIALVLLNGPVWLIIYLAFEGSVFLAAILLERRGYRKRIDYTKGYWQTTGERFVDPTTGRLTEVLYNPTTGERQYVDKGPAKK